MYDVCDSAKVFTDVSAAGVADDVATRRCAARGGAGQAAAMHGISDSFEAAQHCHKLCAAVSGCEDELSLISFVSALNRQPGRQAGSRSHIRVRVLAQLIEHLDFCSSPSTSSSSSSPSSYRDSL